MRVLLAISLLALAGVLWASLAAAQHIRRARRRNRQAATGPSANRAVPPTEGSSLFPVVDSFDRTKPRGTTSAIPQDPPQMRAEQVALQPAISPEHRDKLNRFSDPNVSNRLRSFPASASNIKFRTASR